MHSPAPDLDGERVSTPASPTESGRRGCVSVTALQEDGLGPLCLVITKDNAQVVMRFNLLSIGIHKSSGGFQEYPAPFDEVSEAQAAIAHEYWQELFSGGSK